jgi:hypothetical protein
MKSKIRNFSFQQYKNIIKHLSNKRKIIDFADVEDSSSNFLLLRHDVEYSPERALEMANFEKSIGVTSSYFFQIRNNTYNFLSQNNIEICHKIRALGHKIGLHVHLATVKDETLTYKKIKSLINTDIIIMNNILGFEVDRFSYHRPTRAVLSFDENFLNLYNAYNKKYFTLCEDINKIQKNQPKYISDSNHTWKSMNPFEKSVEDYDKIQLLTHPFSWTKEGYDNFKNFDTLVIEKKKELVISIDSEIKTFPESLKEL